MSLAGRTIKGQGGGYRRVLSTENFPFKIEDKRKLELLKLVRKGNTEAKNELILGHVRLAVSIVDRYIIIYSCRHSDDMLDSAAIEGLTVAVNRVEQGHLKHDNVTGYIIKFIHNYISECLRKLPPVYTPRGHSYPRYVGAEMLEIMVQEDNPHALIVVKDLIDCTIRNERERRIVDLRIIGYTDKEIAKIMDIPQVSVFRIRQTLKQRFERLNHDD